MNEIEQKEIEEMAKVLNEEQVRIANTTDGYSDLMKKGVCYCHARALHNAGYRNCKDKVVLSKEEYQKDFSSQFNKGYKKGSKETAREIFAKLLSKDMIEREEWTEDNYTAVYETVYVDDIRELAKQYGVEVKE